VPDLKFTLKKIASDLGLSITTVSRALANKPNVNEETRKKVIEYIESHQAVLASTHSTIGVTGRIVAVIIPDLSEDYFARVVHAIEDILWQQGSSMMLCETLEDPLKEKKYIEVLRKKKINNIILATVSKDPERVRAYNKDSANIVFFDNLPGLTSNFNAVITDNIRAGIMAVDYLVGLGHNKIGIIAGKQEETTGFERLVGYRRALELNGIPVEETLITLGDFKEESGYRCMNRLLADNKDMTAVFAASSKMTYGAMKALYDKGIKVPDDISMVGFDVHDPTGLIRPGITTILQDEAGIGRLCVELLDKRNTKSGGIPNRRILLEPRLLIRDSCGAARQESH
jgi:LacI family transcriptional regulator